MRGTATGHKHWLNRITRSGRRNLERNNEFMQDRRDFLKTLVIGAAGLVVLPRPAFSQTNDAWSRVYPQILARIKSQTFPKKDFDITKYGAKAGVQNDSSDAISKAIAACSNAGGGHVFVPAGEFLTGAVHLKSNVNLYIAKGATLKFSTDASKYPIVATRFEGMECMNVSPFIYAFEQTNIAITGEGTLDGQSNNDHWWNWHGSARFGGKEGMPNQKAARARLYKMMEDGVPVKDRGFGQANRLRPNFIQPHRCKNVLIEGIKIVNSPM